jgi:hypothetical protein
MTFFELAKIVLTENDSPLTTSEMWQAAVAKGYDKQIKTEGKTPWASFGAKLYMSVKKDAESPFAQTPDRPKKFYLKANANKFGTETELVSEIKAVNVIEPKPAQKRFAYLEKDLHALLTYFAHQSLHCYTKTINHSQSTKKEFGEWVHPDMVGCHYPIDEWKSEVYELSSAIGNVSVKLLSFEVKRELSFGNLRESFFQTVSNSSWANESYLVASRISKEPNFIDELRRLSTSFGIGVIQLKIDNPDQSEIILPARTRDSLDWETVNKLTMNNDFVEFLTRVKIDISSKKIHTKEYDPVLDKEKLKLLREQ